MFRKNKMIIDWDSLSNLQKASLSTIILKDKFIYVNGACGDVERIKVIDVFFENNKFYINLDDSFYKRSTASDNLLKRNCLNCLKK